MSTSKRAAFLIYVENQDEFQKFLQTIKKNEFHYWLDFISKQDTLKSNYIIADLINHRAMWGGNDLRPFGYYTPMYRSISGGAMKVDSFIEICKLLFTSNIPSKEYIVPVNDDIIKVILNDGYTFLHRPAFGMAGSTRTLFTLTPLIQGGIDAAKIGTENITQDEFLKLYIGAKTDVDSFIKEHFTLLQSPVNGFIFITNKGQFVNIAEKGYNFSSFIDELEKENYNVDIDGQRVPNLEELGYIYCDSGMEKGYPYYPYIKLFKLPTPQQFETLKVWIESLSTKTKLEVKTNCDYKRFRLDSTPIEKIFKFINNHTQ